MAAPLRKGTLVLSKPNERRHMHFAHHGLVVLAVRAEPLAQIGILSACFAIAIVAAKGDLLPYGLRWPPSWCSAMAAEALALQVVLEHGPFAPAVRTDNQPLITAASGSNASATHHSRPLARICKRVTHIVGDDISTLVTSCKLVSLPAHKSRTAIGEAKKRGWHTPHCRRLECQ